MSKHGIVTSVHWLPNQVALVIEFSATDKTVSVLTEEQFIKIFGFNLLTTKDRLDLNYLVGMWVDGEVEEDGVFALSSSYQRLRNMEERLNSLSFGIEQPKVLDESGEQQVLQL